MGKIGKSNGGEMFDRLISVVKQGFSSLVFAAPFPRNTV